MHRAIPLWALLAACPAPAPDEPSRQTESFPRCAERDPLRRPFFGDTHVHTTLSLDANLQGTRVGPEDAYRFAKGEPIGLQPFDAEGRSQRTLRIDRPLDFAMVSDHAEFLGTVALCTTTGSPAYDEAACRQFRDNPQLAFLTINALTGAPQANARYPSLCGDDATACVDAGMDVWADLQAAAEAAYDRTDACTFTSFVGYEWSGGPSTYNLHRNVVFRNEVVPALPTSYFDAPYPEGLWERLRAECLDQPPCDVLAIPHNSNLSSGLMFQTLAEGAPTADAAAFRARMEPLVEVFQHKGASECLPGAPGSDELCGFEVIPYATLAGANLDVEATPLPQDFVRTVLGEGLRIQAATGENPYAFGLIASTDTHLGAPGAASEAAYPGHGGAGTSSRDRLPAGLPDLETMNPGGLAVLWAEENSREALFRAMQRREAYGTSGPRIVLRFFGGRDYPADLCDRQDFAAAGYAGGVPMGGALPPGSGAPTFAIYALADAGAVDHPGTPLQRLQIVKGTLVDGEVRVAVHDVAGTSDAQGVDADCQPTDVGAQQLCGVWTDPAFEPDAPAFYYVRALEVPTCRWHVRQCLAAQITCPTDDPDFAACCSERVETQVQERAWSSPIWHHPPE